MITFEEAQRMQKALCYDSMFQPVLRLSASIDSLASALDQAMDFLLGEVGAIVFPWEYAMPFQRQWESVPGIQSVRGHDPDLQPRLWGYFITYRGIDCLATSFIASCVVVSSVRDLREMYETDQVILIDVVAPTSPQLP